MSWKRIPVRIRRADDDHTTPLGDCSADDLSDMPSIVALWGYEGDVVDVSCQFTRDGFEIVVHDRKEPS